MTHTLKIAPRWFDAVERGEKRVEIRKDDRGYRVGDVLVLREYDQAHADMPYTGYHLSVRVTHVLRDVGGLAPGYAALSIEVVRP